MNYQCTICQTVDPFSQIKSESYSKEFKLTEKKGRIDFNGELTVEYQQENDQVCMTAILYNPCTCDSQEQNFILKSGESNLLFGGHGGDTVLYNISLSEIEVKAISLVVLNRYNDRGSVNSVESEVVEIDADLIEIGKFLPKWQYDGDTPPIVKYYDGELLELDFRKKIFDVRVEGCQSELLEVHCPENIYVYETSVIAIRLNIVGIPKQLPPWSEMYRKGSFNAIIVNALPLLGTDSAATRWFTRIFILSENLFFLFPQIISLIEKNAEAGNRYALFALGRYHQCVRRDETSINKAVDCLEKAWAKGLVEAAVALSIIYDYGDIGIVDRPRSKALLTEALDSGCEYAFDYHIRKMLYGLCGVSLDPQQALDMCNNLIKKDIERYGKEEVNPKWYYYKGSAKQAIYGWKHGLEEFQTSADAGLISAWRDIVAVVSYNDQGELVDKAAYWAAIRQGAVKRNDVCAYLFALLKVDDFDKMSQYKQFIVAKQLLIDLEKALEFGSSDAAEELGDIYYSGLYGEAENNEKAFQYYAKGALLYSFTCYEKMFDMIHDHYIDKPLAVRDMIALYGARNGSKKLLSETVIAYTSGRLAEYATEIEQLYVPLFDKEDGDDIEDNDNNIDDDGRFDAYV